MKRTSKEMKLKVVLGNLYNELLLLQEISDCYDLEGFLHFFENNPDVSVDQAYEDKNLWKELLEDAGIEFEEDTDET